MNTMKAEYASSTTDEIQHGIAVAYQPLSTRAGTLNWLLVVGRTAWFVVCRWPRRMR